MKVLVVDDDPNVHRLISICLKKLGITEIVQATNGKECLNLYLSEKPDFVLLDFVMPGVQGDEVLRQIKEKDPDAKVAILSSVNSLEKVKRCVELGAFHYILKDSSPEQLFNNLRELKSMVMEADPVEAVI